MASSKSGNKNNNNPNYEIFIGNLPTSVSEADLLDLLDVYGKPTKMEIHPPKTGKKFHFAIIAFDSVAKSESAVRELNGMKYKSNTLNVHWNNHNRPPYANPHFFPGPPGFLGGGPHPAMMAAKPAFWPTDGPFAFGGRQNGPAGHFGPRGQQHRGNGIPAGMALAHAQAAAMAHHAAQGGNRGRGKKGQPKGGDFFWPGQMMDYGFAQQKMSEYRKKANVNAQKVNDLENKSVDTSLSEIVRAKIEIGRLTKEKEEVKAQQITESHAKSGAPTPDWRKICEGVVACPKFAIKPTNVAYDSIKKSIEFFRSTKAAAAIEQDDGLKAMKTEMIKSALAALAKSVTEFIEPTKIKELEAGLVMMQAMDKMKIEDMDLKNLEPLLSLMEVPLSILEPEVKPSSKPLTVIKKEPEPQPVATPSGKKGKGKKKGPATTAPAKVPEPEPEPTPAKAAEDMTKEEKEEDMKKKIIEDLVANVRKTLDVLLASPDDFFAATEAEKARQEAEAARIAEEEKLAAAEKEESSEDKTEAEAGEKKEEKKEKKEKEPKTINGFKPPELTTSSVKLRKILNREIRALKDEITLIKQGESELKSCLKYKLVSKEGDVRAMMVKIKEIYAIAKSIKVDYDEDFDFQPNDEVEEILERASKEPKEEQENGDDDVDELEDSMSQVALDNEVAAANGHQESELMVSLMKSGALD